MTIKFHQIMRRASFRKQQSCEKTNSSAFKKRWNCQSRIRFQKMTLIVSKLIVNSLQCKKYLLSKIRWRNQTHIMPWVINHLMANLSWSYQKFKAEGHLKNQDQWRVQEATTKVLKVASYQSVAGQRFLIRNKKKSKI